MSRFVSNSPNFALAMMVLHFLPRANSNAKIDYQLNFNLEAGRYQNNEKMPEMQPRTGRISPMRVLRTCF
jgi:hypothetical protein